MRYTFLMFLRFLYLSNSKPGKAFWRKKQVMLRRGFFLVLFAQVANGVCSLIAFAFLHSISFLYTLGFVVGTSRDDIVFSLLFYAVRSKCWFLSRCFIIGQCWLGLHTSVRREYHLASCSTSEGDGKNTARHMYQLCKSGDRQSV